MSLFQKVGQSANKLFSKISNSPNLMRKIHNTVGQVDNAVSRVGSFLVPITTMINPAVGGSLATGIAATHQIANGLEKATRSNDDNNKSNYA